MAISEESRHRLFQQLEGVLGPDEAATLMEHLPPVGWADVATKHDLNALEQRIDLRFALVDQRFDTFERSVDRRFIEVERRFDQVDHRFGRLEADVAALRADLRASVFSLMALMVALNGAVLAAIKF